MAKIDSMLLYEAAKDIKAEAGNLADDAAPSQLERLLKLVGDYEKLVASALKKARGPGAKRRRG